MYIYTHKQHVWIEDGHLCLVYQGVLILGIYILYMIRGSTVGSK